MFLMIPTQLSFVNMHFKLFTLFILNNDIYLVSHVSMWIEIFVILFNNLFGSLL